MLMFLALLCVLWIGYWSFSLLRDKDQPSPVYISRHECADCAKGSIDKHAHARRESQSSVSGNVSNTNNTSKPDQSVGSNQGAGSSQSTGSKQSADSSQNTDSKRSADSSQSTGSKQSADSSQSASPSTSAPVSAASKSSKSGAVPLFTAPVDTEADDLKEIKGVGVVMEGTLNDLGITTFKQLAEFKDAEVQMVTDALSELNAGFGDRITRDEWVKQAKELAMK